MSFQKSIKFYAHSAAHTAYKQFEIFLNFFFFEFTVAACMLKTNKNTTFYMKFVCRRFSTWLQQTHSMLQKKKNKALTIYCAIYYEFLSFRYFYGFCLWYGNRLLNYGHVNKLVFHAIYFIFMHHKNHSFSIFFFFALLRAKLYSLMGIVRCFDGKFP